MLPPSAVQFLLSRSYSDDLITSEPITCVTEMSPLKVEDVEVTTNVPLIAWVCRSMSGALIGVQTRHVDKHEYRWFQAPKAHHLPIVYATEADHTILFESGKMVMTEGIFDRAAIKRVLPDYAVYARLSKGIAKQLLTYVERYGKTLFLAFDNDEPGERATELALKRLEGKLDVHRLVYPAKDPSQLIESRGLLKTRTLIERQVRTLEI